jgi:hypothetical protein
MIRCRTVVLVISIAITLMWGEYTLDYSLSQFSFTRESGYDRISADGFIFCDEPGTPELPSIYLHYIIPPYAKVDSLIEIQHTMVQVPGRFRVYPTQPVVVQGETVPWVPPDTLIYNSNDFYAEKYIEIVNEGVIDGARIVTVAVHPLVYRPQSKRLYLVTHLEFDYALGQTMLPDLRPLIRGEYEQMVYDAAIERLVENDFQIPVYYQKPTIVEYNQLGTDTPFPLGPAMIITDTVFADAFQPYADWLTDQGIKAQLISPQLIYSYFSGIDEAEKIRNYIKYCYRNAGGTWFILGGMDDRFTSPPVPPELPSRRCFCVDILQYPPHPPHYDTIPTDHYYCALDGDWNADGDATWGEMNDEVDQFPEVFVGRILCRDVQEVQNWVYKALVYERTPANTEMFDNALWIYQNGLESNKWYMGNAINRFPDHFTHTIAENYSAYEALNQFNRGYGFTHGQTHGSILCFPTGYPGGSVPEHWIWSSWEAPPTPASDSVGLDWLTNENEYFIHYAVSCHTAFYDDYAYTCIAQALTTKYQSRDLAIPIGACASIEHTRYSLYWPSHTLQDKYYGLLFTEEYPGASFSRIGYSLAQAKTQVSWNWSSYRYVCYGTNLFGSPTTPAWTDVPRNFAVTHPGTIIITDPTLFVVHVADGESDDPVGRAKVCVNKQGDIYMVRNTDGDGNATFPITPGSIGTLKVTVTRYHNDGSTYTQYLPSQTTCRVIYSESDGGPQALKVSAPVPNHLCITQLSTLLRDGASVKYGIPEENEISLVMYDITGSLVKTIKRGLVHPGYYEERIDTRDLANGVYFVVLRQSNDNVTRKCVVLK